MTYTKYQIIYALLFGVALGTVIAMFIFGICVLADKTVSKKEKETGIFDSSIQAGSAIYKGGEIEKTDENSLMTNTSDDTEWYDARDISPEAEQWRDKKKTVSTEYWLVKGDNWEMVNWQDSNGNSATDSFNVVGTGNIGLLTKNIRRGLNLTAIPKAYKHGIIIPIEIEVPDCNTHEIVKKQCYAIQYHYSIPGSITYATTIINHEYIFLDENGFVLPDGYKNYKFKQTGCGASISKDKVLEILKNCDWDSFEFDNKYDDEQLELHYN